MKAKILLVDDEQVILKEMHGALASDYTVFTASNAGDAMNLYREERPPVVTLDLALNPGDAKDFGGIRLLEQMLTQDPSTRAIMLTGHNDDSAALRAMELGAFDYYTKPVRFDELKVMINRGVHLHRLLHKARQANERVRSGFHGLFGSSDATAARRTFHRTHAPLDPVPTNVNLKLAKKAIEMDFIKKALARNRGVVSRAARELGISRVNLYDLLQKYDIRPNEFKILRATLKAQTREVS